MRKLPWLMLALVMVLYTSIAHSRICFLADTDCQEGKLEVSLSQGIDCFKQNSSWKHESKRCNVLTYTSVCNDKTGNYFEETGCTAGYSDMTNPDINGMYTCSTSLECGRCCKDEDLLCKSEYKVCQSPTKPAQVNANKTCKEKTEDAVDKFTLCYCDTSEYKYNKSNCGGAGLALDGDSCTGDNGTWYKSCKCASGYTKVTASNIGCPSSCKYGCSSLGNTTDVPLPDTSYFCWTGAECAPKPANVCPLQGLTQYSDFDNYWSYQVEVIGNIFDNKELFGE